LIDRCPTRQSLKIAFIFKALSLPFLVF